MDARSDAFLTLPGGLGTLEELLEIWVSRTLAMHAKPVVVLDPDGLYEPLRAQVDLLVERGFVRDGARDASPGSATSPTAFDAIEAAARRRSGAGPHRRPRRGRSRPSPRPGRRQARARRDTAGARVPRMAPTVSQHPPGRRHLVGPEDPRAVPGAERGRGEGGLQPAVLVGVEHLAEELLVRHRHQHRPAGRDQLVQPPGELQRVVGVLAEVVRRVDQDPVGRVRRPRPPARPARSRWRPRRPPRRRRRPGAGRCAAAGRRRGCRPAPRRSAATAASPGSEPCQASLSRSAPASQTARPTPARQVSTLIARRGCRRRTAATNGATRRTSSASVDLLAGPGLDPADVDDRGALVDRPVDRGHRGVVVEVGALVEERVGGAVDDRHHHLVVGPSSTSPTRSDLRCPPVRAVMGPAWHDPACVPRPAARRPRRDRRDRRRGRRSRRRAARRRAGPVAARRRCPTGTSTGPAVDGLRFTPRAARLPDGRGRRGARPAGRRAGPARRADRRARGPGRRARTATRRAPPGGLTGGRAGRHPGGRGPGRSRSGTLLTDWDVHDRWMLLTRAEGGRAEGETISAFTGVGPVGFLDTMMITVWEPPPRAVVRHTGRRWCAAPAPSRSRPLGPGPVPGRLVGVGRPAARRRSAGSAGRWSRPRRCGRSSSCRCAGSRG